MIVSPPEQRRINDKLPALHPRAARALLWRRVSVLYWLSRASSRAVFFNSLIGQCYTDTHSYRMLPAPRGEGVQQPSFVRSLPRSFDPFVPTRLFAIAYTLQL